VTAGTLLESEPPPQADSEAAAPATSTAPRIEKRLIQAPLIEDRN
jgi:hypothetical protein